MKEKRFGDTYYFHDVKQFGFYSTSFAYLFTYNSPNINFEDKENKIAFASVHPKRKTNREYLNYFNIKKDDIKRIGPETLKEMRENLGLSENELQNEYSKYRFICCPKTNTECGTWIRSRVIYAMKNNCIALMLPHDAKYFGKPFELNSNIFNLDIQQQKEIAKQQREYFYSHIMTKKQSIENIANWLR